MFDPTARVQPGLDRCAPVLQPALRPLPVRRDVDRGLEFALAVRQSGPDQRRQRLVPGLDVPELLPRDRGVLAAPDVAPVDPEEPLRRLVGLHDGPVGVDHDRRLP
ncbi:hypothetical protein DP107_10735 [Haloglomus irregulare]|uniref:Uncharacterized protein n=1 Tax=Haloglomus irregulare TaxID=2234134 RepID=A0A554N8C0_9EURY|nr:hypothetical protein [Haloglomus irregulare]TSD13643.1 hypothetical protein DP107_10735 [Haloglomus irregulare]